jgi:hypothetical protein
MGIHQMSKNFALTQSHSMEGCYQQQRQHQQQQVK